MADMLEDEEDGLELQVEHVRQMLRDAFPGMGSQLFGKDFTHADFVEMRLNLPLFLSEDLQLALPWILEELMDTHINDDVTTENVEFILMNLNVDAYVSEETYEEWSKTFGEARVEHDRKSRVSQSNFRQESFALITPDQAKAIYQWLLLARNWRDFDYWSDDLKGALDYWRSRANSD